MRFLLYIPVVFIFLMGLGACQNAKFLEAHSKATNKHKRVFDEYLVVKNRIEINKKKKNKKKNGPILCADSVLVNVQNHEIASDIAYSIYSDLYAMLRQKPNKVFLWGRPFLWAHNVADTLKIKYVYDPNFSYTNDSGLVVKGGIRPDTLNIKKVIATEHGDSIVYKKGRLRKFFMTKVGEPPVIFDSTESRITARSMQNYLIQKGFLDAKVGFIADIKRYKARVSYYYFTGAPLLIDTVIFESVDPAMKKIMEEVKPQSALKAGNPLDKSAFMLEKTRLTQEVRNRGYYHFDLNRINYAADTVNVTKPDTLTKNKKDGIVESKRAAIYVIILPESDSTVNHTQYFIRDVYIVPDPPERPIHALKRKYPMDTTFVVLRPPRKKQEVSHIFSTALMEDDSLAHFRLERKGERRILTDISKEKTKSIMVIANGKYPYWIRLKKYNGTEEETLTGAIVEEGNEKLTLTVPVEKNKSYYKYPHATNVLVNNPLDNSLYWVKIKPYRRRFVRNSYKKDYMIEEGDISVHIILRKPAKTVEIDSIKAIKDIAQKKKDYFVLRDQVLSQNVLINSGSVYNYDAKKETERRLSELEIFKLPRVVYTESASGVPNELDAYIYAQKSKKQQAGIETDFNTSNAYLGWALNLSYRNRNLFKGAELLVWNMEGGINFNFNPNADTFGLETGLARWINLLDINMGVSLYFPKIIGFRNWSLSVDNPKTKIGLNYHYLQQSSDFRVSSFDASYSYEWDMKKKVHSFSWSPFMLNVIPIEPYLNPDFESRIKQSNYALWVSLKDLYFIPGTNFTYQFSPKSKKGEHFFYLKTFGETAGNTAWAADAINPDDPLTFFTVAYSQYIKADFDLRYSWKMAKKHTIATRLLVGGAIPYGNSSRVPYSRQFFLGGPSSMRGWNMRHLGPGRVRPESGAAFQLGDLRLEMNAEYRFMFNTWIGGALFVDAGNIWLTKAEAAPTAFPLSPGPTGVISKDFLSELAMDVGVGVRADMSFFVIRVDLAFQIHNPAGFIDASGNDVGADGLPIYWKWGRGNWTLAIGYPF